jgi:hypothetical protein
VANLRGIARFLLNRLAAHLGLERVEGKQKLVGHRSGTTWEIDAKGVRSDDGGIVLIECRRQLSHATTQEDMGALVYRILDSKAEAAILVSPIDPQAGAKLLAAAEGVVHVRLTPESTTEAYVLQFLNQTFIGVAPEVITIKGEVAAVLVQAPGESPS